MTYIELLLALSIAGLTAAAGAEALRTGGRRFQQLQAGWEYQSEAGAAIALLRQDFRCAYLSDDDSTSLFSGRADDAAASDRLDFVRAGADGDLFSEVGYFSRRDPDSGGWELWRRTQSPTDADLLNGGKTVLLCRRLRRVRFQYFDGETWCDTWGWDKERGQPTEHIRGLPLAVRMELVLISDESLEIKTIFPLMVPHLNWSPRA